MPGVPLPSRSRRVNGQRLTYVARPASDSETRCIRSRFAEPVRTKRPLRRGASVSTARFTASSRFGFPLYFIQRQARRTTNQVVRC